ncbi:hypothetical protein [Fortiea sp. LEGE XX443]|uniref:hypothetical protein n=1 Tax=Fortiea sp. LEGE XX443 TaxID=1828611 RepID=UPI00351C29EA
MRLIQYFATTSGSVSTLQGAVLNVKLFYYHMARSIEITYEERVRLLKSLKSVIAYSRGGKLTILNGEKLEAIASGIILPGEIVSSGSNQT